VVIVSWDGERGLESSRFVTNFAQGHAGWEGGGGVVISGFAGRGGHGSVSDKFCI
jgi:hypothetical protein